MSMKHVIPLKTFLCIDKNLKAKIHAYKTRLLDISPFSLVQSSTNLEKIFLALWYNTTLRTGKYSQRSVCNEDRDTLVTKRERSKSKQNKSIVTEAILFEEVLRSTSSIQSNMHFLYGL